jgi:hypothetical protein
MSLEEELAAFAAEPPPPKPNPAQPPKPSGPPYTIRTIIEQCGGMGLRGAFVYIGASQFSYKCPDVETECRGHRSSVTKEGLVDYGVGLTFRVNGKRGAGWRMMIAYEPDDTYSVYLWRRAKPTEEKAGRRGVVIGSYDDVYCDMLKEVVEQMYDRAIKEHNDGFIPL